MLKTVDALKSKLVVRLLPQVDAALRQRTRRQGDLSRFVEEAIAAAPDLTTIPLAPASSEEMPRPTTVTLKDKTRAVVGRAAVRRGAPSNVLINAALWHWLRSKPAVNR